MTSSPCPPPPKTPTLNPNSTRRVGCHRWFCWVHECGRIACILATLIVGPLLALWVVGLPPAATNRLLATIPMAPLLPTAERLSFEPTRGFVLHNLLLYSTDSFAEPLVRIPRLVVRPRILPLLRGRFEPNTISIENGTLYAPPWTRNELDGSLYKRLIPSNVYSTIRFKNQNEARIDALRAELFSIHASARGDVTLTHGTRSHGKSGPQRFYDVLTALPDAPYVAAELATTFSGLRPQAGGKEPTLQAQFHIAPTGTVATATLEGASLKLYEQPVDALHAIVEWRNNTLWVHDARVQANREAATLDLNFDLATREALFSITSSVSPMLVRELVFSAQRYIIDKIGITNGANLQLSLQGGPATWPTMQAAAHGHFSFTRLDARGASLSSATGTISGALDEWHVTDVRTRFGANGERGEGSGHFIFHDRKRVLEGDLSLHTDPNDFIPFLGSNLAHFVQRFAFDKPLPHFVGTFHHTFATDSPVILGALAATNFSYRGVPIDQMQTSLAFSNHLVELDDWHFTQTNGETKGTLAADLHADLLAADLESTMNPAALAAMVSPKLYHDLSEWHFKGPVRLLARGVVDLSEGDAGTDLLLSVAGEKLGRGRWSASRATFDVHVLGQHYFITNIVGRAYGGDLTAQVVVGPVPAGPDQRYVTHIVLSNANLASIARHNAKNLETVPKGAVFLDLQLTGLVSEAIGPATRGSGTLKIEDGALFELRLFGGLSDLLSRIVPGLGIIAQTDMDTAFTIAEQAITTDNLRLSGDVLSLKATGDVEFDGRLDFRAQVQLLRRGPLAVVLRLLTMPVTKLFEFQLTGTLDEPKWRPVNLPKELFLIFD